MALLTAAHYPAIRSAIDVSLTAAQVPDLIIAQPIYHAAAEAAVLRRVPTADSLTGAERDAAVRAAILLAAALLAPAVPGLLEESFADIRYRRSQVDLEARAAALMERAEAELATLDAVAVDYPPVPYAGGISEADKAAAEADEDRVEPAFTRTLLEAVPRWGLWG